MARFEKGQPPWNKGLKVSGERDDYTCQICSVRGGSLQVDHIKKWSKHPELRFAENNCRTLCSSCHYRITYNREMDSSVKAWGHNLKHVLGEGIV